MKCMIDKCFPRSTYNIALLCRSLGISRIAYYNILNNKSIPSVDLALRICDYFQNQVLKNDDINIDCSDLFNIYVD